MKLLQIFSRQSKREHAMIIQGLAEASKKMDELIAWLNPTFQGEQEDCDPQKEEEK